MTPERAFDRSRSREKLLKKVDDLQDLVARMEQKLEDRDREDERRQHHREGL